jgi:hypothetical protein
VRSPVRRAPLILALLSIACGAPAQAGPPPRPPGVLHSPADYATDFVIDQRVTASFEEEQQSFRAILEKHGDSLVMVGLGPHGGRAFVLTQHGTEVSFESQLPRELPFPPEYMLLDVHRAWLVALPGAPLADGEHQGTIDDEEVTETWADGRMLTRSFRRLDGTPPGLLTITYEGGLTPALDAPAPTRVVLENGWYGYRLELDELTRRALAP